MQEVVDNMGEKCLLVVGKGKIVVTGSYFDET